MQRSVRVIVDGEVLRPEEPLDLRPRERYVVTIEVPPAEPDETDLPGVLDDLADLITDVGVTDLAAQHDHSLYGTQQR